MTATYQEVHQAAQIFCRPPAVFLIGRRLFDLTYRFDGRQAAKIPDWVVPQNLTHQFTITTWMKHGPSPGQRAEKETLLCNSDKT
ncbi:hypothetical protein M9458_030991, partial [Cirrhinus mrigala]